MKLTYLPGTAWCSVFNPRSIMTRGSRRSLNTGVMHVKVPIPYTVTYDPAEIDQRNTYSMSARIEDGSGKLLWISDTATPVITRGSPTQDVEIVVVQVGSP